MVKKQRFMQMLFMIAIVLPLPLMAVGGQVQDGGPNPTPLVITLTLEAPATAVPTTAVPSPTNSDLWSADRFEPNNDPSTATAIGWQIEPGLTLVGDDVDYFTGYLKVGQMMLVSTFVYGGLDTRLSLYWADQMVAENDDRSPVDMGSTVTFAAPADGWYVLLVAKATNYDGLYDLETALVTPTATAMALPTLTSVPTLTPSASSTPILQPDLAEPNDSQELAYPIIPGLFGSYTVGAGDVDYFTFIAKAGTHYACETITNQVDTLLTVVGDSSLIGSNDDRGMGRVDSYFAWTAVAEQAVVIKVEARGGSFGAYDFSCQQVALPPPAAVSPAATAAVVPTVASPLSTTMPLAATGPVSLTVEYIGTVQPQTDLTSTSIRLLVYYDANNDRQPGPGEGIAGVSVLAVDGRGQRLARVFTNVQGEAVFNLSNEAVARVIVPFVPGWSARVRAGELNHDIVLGLPAVRLPIFLPVQNAKVSRE